MCGGNQKKGFEEKLAFFFNENYLEDVIEEDSQNAGRYGEEKEQGYVEAVNNGKGYENKAWNILLFYNQRT